jgi:hypothetical protein
MGDHGQNRKEMNRVLFCTLALFLSLNGSARAQTRDKLSHYLYEDTKQLVALVEDAGSLTEQKGEAALLQFGVRNSKWLNDQRYQASLLKASIVMSSDCGCSPACARTLLNKASVVAAAVWPD